MDTSGFSQVGRYGTISLMKRADPHVAVTAFGIDTPELTFGRDPSCGVRLYYNDVSMVHCKIIFEDNKAFLVVLGQSGLTVDGCKVSPNASPSANVAPTTIPLTNNSDFEIHGKRFKFTYPPKELRPALYASPVRAQTRAPRLSLIKSSHVFSPRPSPDPRENLRILQSPLKNTFKSPFKLNFFTTPLASLFSGPKAVNSPSPLPMRKAATPEDVVEDDDDEPENIVLVQGNHPRVVEEEKDLVILEDVEVPLPEPLSYPYYQQQIHSPQHHLAANPPETPVRRRSLSLHRAVLIRSAQRAVMKAERDEMERGRQEEDEQEEMEVFDAVANDHARDGESDDELHEQGENNIEMDEEEAETQEHEEDVLDATDEDETKWGRNRYEKPEQKSPWKNSLERIWPSKSSDSTQPIQSEEQVDVREARVKEDEDDGEDVETENQDVVTAFELQPTPLHRPLGSFMTPQVKSYFRSQSKSDINQAPQRFSLGGGEAQRVVLRSKEQIWKVSDIVVPLPIRTGNGTMSNEIPFAGSELAPSPRKAQIDEKERKAIQERRRSALREVTAGRTSSFFPGGVPGLGAASPAKLSSVTTSSAEISLLLNSSTPAEGQSPVRTGKELLDQGKEAESEALDTRGLLEKMKETVDEMKRRRSMAPPSTPKPQGALIDTELTQEKGAVFSLLRTPAASKTPLSFRHEDHIDHESTEQMETDEPQIVTVESLAVEHSKEMIASSRKGPGRLNVIEKKVMTEKVQSPRIETSGHSETTYQSATEPEAEADEENELRKLDAPHPTKDRRDDPEATKAESKTAPAKLSRRKAAATEVEESGDVKKTTLVRRGRKAAFAEDQDKVPVELAAAARSRSRKPTAGTTRGTVSDETTTRRGRSTTKASDLTAATTGAGVPTSRATTKRATSKNDEEPPDSRSQRGTKPQSIRTENGADLDDTEASTLPATTKASGRKKATTTLELNGEEPLRDPTPTTKPKETKATSALKTPAVRGRARKAPSTAPEVGNRKEKENTPGPGPEVSSSPDGDPEPVKVRVSKTSKKAVSGTTASRGKSAKAEVDKAEEATKEAPKGRVMRATRARTRT